MRFASARHADQYREIDHAPFIAHPIEVGSLLRRDGQPDEIIAAGLLHDVLEKTATTSAELHRRFGPQIALLVESVSDDPSLGGYRPRKRELRDRVAHADPGARAVFAADKIAKVRELALLPARQLNEPKNRAKLAHYRASLEMLQRVDRDAPLVASARRRAQPTPRARRHRNPQRRPDHERHRLEAQQRVELPQSERCPSGLAGDRKEGGHISALNAIGQPGAGCSWAETNHKRAGDPGPARDGRPCG